MKDLAVRLARRFGAARLLGLLLLMVLVVFRAWDPPPLQTFRLKIFDFYQQLKPRETNQFPVVIADIDDASLQMIGQWPWPRTKIAELVQRITASGAVAIAFDVLFPEPDRMSPGLIADSLQSIDEETRRKLKNAPSNDVLLGLAFRRARVVAGQSGHNELNVGSDKHQTSVGTLGKDPRPYLISYPGLLLNVPELESTATGRGLFSISPEHDGVVRRVPLMLQAQGRIVPALSTELLRVATGSNAVLIKTGDHGINSVVVARNEVPTGPRGQLWVHYSKSDPRRYIPVHKILNGPLPVPGLAQRLVLVGTSATGMHDLKTTPVDPAMPGVEIHAQVIENILSGTRLKRPAELSGIEVAIAFGIGLMMIILVPAFGPLPVFAIGAVTAATLTGMSWYKFTEDGVLLDVAYPLLSSFAVFGFLAFMNYYREEAQRRQIRSAFGQYLSPDLVEQLAENPEKLVLGGETRTMTILFSDVRGFTSISESFKEDPQGLTSLMNRFLTPLSDAIMERRGTIDKYMGDAIMAFWNAPLDDPDHAVNATRAGIDMLHRLETVNLERKKEAEEAGIPFLPLDVGVGINTGDCVVGNMGSESRFDYSLLGDSVNLASRLEGQTKTYGINIILGAMTASLVGEAFFLLEVDTIRVKGKTEPEKIYTVVENPEAADFEAYSAAHRDMLTAYLGQDWDGVEAAIRICRPMAETYGLTGVLDLYAQRTAAFREAPPPADWDGVWTMETK